MTLLDSTGDMLNPPIVDHVSLLTKVEVMVHKAMEEEVMEELTSGSSGSIGSGTINIVTPELGTLYSSDGMDCRLNGHTNRKAMICRV